MSLWGGLLRLGYRLARHRIGPLALSSSLLFVAAIWLAVAHGRASWPLALLFGAISLALSTITLIARQQKYLRFRPDESLAAHLPPGVAALEPDEQVPVQVSGLLEVEGRQQYFVAAGANYATMETREHIVMARIPASRMWLVALWPEEEVGWWYVFARPVCIRGIRTGWLHHGLRPHPALELTYERRRLVTGKGKPKAVSSEQIVYLSVAELVTLHRLLDDLVRDAGQDVGYGEYVPF